MTIYARKMLKGIVLSINGKITSYSWKPGMKTLPHTSYKRKKRKSYKNEKLFQNRRARSYWMLYQANLRNLKEVSFQISRGGWTLVLDEPKVAGYQGRQSMDSNYLTHHQISRGKGGGSSSRGPAPLLLRWYEVLAQTHQIN